MRSHIYFSWLVTAFLILASDSVTAQSWKWAKTYSCNISIASDLGMVAYDQYSSLPGAYITLGFLGDSLCLGTFTIHNEFDSVQTIVAKYDTAGNVLWVSSSVNGQCEPMNITVDSEGNLLLYAMLLTDSVEIDGHVIVNPNYIPGGWVYKNHCFIIIKYDPFGHVVWTTCGGEVDETGAFFTIGGITLDASNNVYVSGAFDDSMLIVGTHTFVNSHKDSGDIFIIKYSSDGNYIWGKTFGGISPDLGEQIYYRKDNKLLLTGRFQSPLLSFGSVTLTHTGSNTWGGKDNLFIAELDTAGNAIWAKNPVGDMTQYSFALDNDGNIYVGGSLNDSFVNFGLDSFSSATLWLSGFFAKYDTAGNELWAKTIQTLTPSITGYENSVTVIAIDPCNNAWITGALRRDSIELNDSIIFHTPLTGPDPMLFAGFNPDGNLIECRAFTSGGDDNAGMVSDCHGDIYMAGDIGGTIEFGLDTIHAVSEQMFLAKYDPGLGCVGGCRELVSESINKINDKNSTTIFPNPSVNEININSDQKLSSILLYDIYGRLLDSFGCDCRSTKLDISRLPAGIYLLRINGTIISKIVKE